MKINSGTLRVHSCGYIIELAIYNKYVYTNTKACCDSYKVVCSY